jgi:hypothetical protein
MAKYAATTSVTVYKTIEAAVAGLETTLEGYDQARPLIRWDIVPVPGGKFAVWTCYTDAT